MKKYYQVIISRLNGDRIKSDFKEYLALVKKGIAGFIIFGGELEEVRAHIKRLQSSAPIPLIISSDLERGLGQQLKGGTVFPPAMALARAIKSGQLSAISVQQLKLLRKTFRAVAEEAVYAGINTIFAPVLDINTNPKNPIIATRAFGEDPATVSFFGCEMIKTLQKYGISACGKHFPGHGDTETDSHISLPSIDSGLHELVELELQPFQKAAAAKVRMIMLGHLRVSAIDPSGIPVSLSEKAVGFLRKEMKFRGIVITDAMNMGGLGGFSEETAACMALEAGVDIILHPTDADRISSYLASKDMELKTQRLEEFRRGLNKLPLSAKPDFEDHIRLSRTLTAKAITISGDFSVRQNPCLIILNDDEDSSKGRVLIEALNAGFPGIKTLVISRASGNRKLTIPRNMFVITAIFSETKAWKGGAGSLLLEQVSSLEGKTDLYVSFGSPFLLDHIEGTKMFAYWDSEAAQEAAAEAIIKRGQISDTAG